MSSFFEAEWPPPFVACSWVCAGELDATEDQQDHENDHDEAEHSARCIAPLTAVRIDGQRADEEKDEDDEDDGAEHEDSNVDASRRRAN